MPTLSLTYPTGTPDGFQLLPDAKRTAMEEAAYVALDKALTAWGRAILAGITADKINTVLARLDNPMWQGNLVMRDELIRVLRDAADVGVVVGSGQIESAVYGMKSVKFTIPSLDDMIDWTMAHAEAAKWSITYGFQLIHGITAVTRQIVATEVEYFINNSLTINEMRDRLVSQTGGAFSPARARRIAVTEVTRAYAEGNLAAWRTSGVVREKEWYTAVDRLVCRYCAPLHGVVVPMDKPFPGGINAPPAHVGCRCEILPVVIGDRGDDLTQWKPKLMTDGSFDWVQVR